MRADALAAFCARGAVGPDVQGGPGQGGLAAPEPGQLLPVRGRAGDVRRVDGVGQQVAGRADRSERALPHQRRGGDQQQRLAWPGVPVSDAGGYGFRVPLRRRPAALRDAQRTAERGQPLVDRGQAEQEGEDSLVDDDRAVQRGTAGAEAEELPVPQRPGRAQRAQVRLVERGERQPERRLGARAGKARLHRVPGQQDNDVALERGEAEQGCELVEGRPGLGGGGRRAGRGGPRAFIRVQAGFAGPGRPRRLPQGLVDPVERLGQGLHQVALTCGVAVTVRRCGGGAGVNAVVFLMTTTDTW